MTEVQARAKTMVRDQVPPKTFTRLEIYTDLLLAANREQNMISKSSEAEIWARHIADSAQLAPYLPQQTEDIVLDLGTGPGLPGVVLAIMGAQRYILVESRKRRCAFLHDIIDRLALGDRVEIRCASLSAVRPFTASAIVARAFAPIVALLDSARPFSAANTIWVLPRGRKASLDYAALSRRQKEMFHVEQSITDTDAGILIGKGAV